MASEEKLARVIAEHKGIYRVKNADGEFWAKITGKQIFNATGREDYPAVGDYVMITELNSEQAVICRILPRKTIIKRKYGDKNKVGEKNETQIIATNIDIAFVVESVDRDYNLNRFERYFALANDGGVMPAIILNKIDLISKEELALKLNEIKKRLPGYDIISTSTTGDEGLNELKNYIEKDKTYCFLGSSGVGKSSLINKLLGKDVIRTMEISSATEKGKHTTTSRGMYFLPARPDGHRGAGEGNGGIVIDNPGMREVGIADVTMGMDSVFDKISNISKNCKFADCAHREEANCAVIAAVKRGDLDENKYSNYVKLKKESEFYDLNQLERREKDRQFGKFVKSAKKEIKKYKG